MECFLLFCERKFWGCLLLLKEGIQFIVVCLRVVPYSPAFRFRYVLAFPPSLPPSLPPFLSHEMVMGAHVHI